jgi:NAD dependent epimerase/dehydratase family enzyme
MTRITVTGATGLIGKKLVAALQARGDEVTVLSRRPKDARRMLGVDAVGWQPDTEPAPVDGLAGRDGVVHLAGEPIAQRWTQESKERIRSSRELGTAQLVDGLEQSEPRPRILVTASASATTARVTTSVSTKTRRPGRTSSQACARSGSARPPRPPTSECAP